MGIKKRIFLNQPVGITFIGCYQIISALVLLITINIEQNPHFNIRFAVPFIPETFFKFILGISTIIISYGYLRQFKWGYISMVVYASIFSIISLIQFIRFNEYMFLTNSIYALFQFVYTIFQRDKFRKQIL